MKVGNLGQVVSLFVVNNDLKVLDDEISYGICSNSFPITHEITNIDKSVIEGRGTKYLRKFHHPISCAPGLSLSP